MSANDGEQLSLFEIESSSMPKKENVDWLQGYEFALRNFDDEPVQRDYEIYGGQPLPKYWFDDDQRAVERFSTFATGVLMYSLLGVVVLLIAAGALKFVEAVF